MPEYPYDHDDSPFRTQIPGAHRPSTNPRLHAVAKPYSRPSSYSGPSSQIISNGNGIGNPPAKAPVRTTRSQLPTFNSSGSLTRSGSDSSLFSGLKSIFSRPLQWLATPSRAVVTPGGTKRDVYSSFGQDMEAPESPTDRREGKRIRRTSPRLGTDEYAPKKLEIEGRAVSGFMLPALPPQLSLASRSQQSEKPLPNRTNFSCPLNMPSSKSMPYLDPPTSLLNSPAQRGIGMGMGSMSRSRRMELAGFGDEDHDMVGGQDMSSRKGKEKESERYPQEDAWNPWRNRPTTPQKASTPVRGSPTRVPEPREYALPSLSPFKVPPSPSSIRQATPNLALGRSATTLNLRRAASVVSDVSMGQDTIRRTRQTSSMLFKSVNGDREKDDERMSVDGGRSRDGREGSVQDWFMKDRWTSREPGSPASRAASMRLSSVGPSSGVPSIRKGQLVWDADKGFVRESELKAAEAHKPVDQNDAERILFALESMRKTPLADARKSSTYPSNTLPPDLIGSSSRQLRKAISVPLATAQADETAKHRRDSDRLGDKSLSVMISPYGRRIEVDRALRDARRSEQSQERESDFRFSQSPSNHGSRRSDRSSQVSDQEMRSGREITPPVHTPRRSSRLKRHDGEEEVTPKAKKTKGKGGGSVKKAAVETKTPKDTRRRTRQATTEKGTSPEPRPSVPSVPTIMETAPSPSQESSISSTYAPRADGDLPKGSSSLRARTELTKRTHTGAASYNSSRATSPSTGRFSAREEDLPPMDELEQASKIPLPSFSGISFGSLNNGAVPVPDSKTTSTSSGAGASDRTGSKSLATSLNVPSSSRLSGGPLTRMNGGPSTRPRASSPLASGSIVPESGSPPKSTSPSAQPTPSDGFFRLSQTNPAPSCAETPPSTLFAGLGNAGPDGPKKTLGFGMGKPSAPEEDKSTSSGVPDFFGTKSKPTSGTCTPSTSPAHFNFGLPSNPTESAPAFTFSTQPAQSGAPNGVPGNSGESNRVAESSKPAQFSFAAPKAAEAAAASKPTFSFSTTKAPEATKPALVFGAQSSTPTSSDTSTETHKQAFSFGASTTPSADKSAEVPNAPFPSGAPSAPVAAEVPKTAFSFGMTKSSGPPSEPANDAPKHVFSFGAQALNNSPITNAAPNPFGGFSFNKPPEPVKDSSPATNSTAPGFKFGQNNGSAIGNNKEVNGTTARTKANPFSPASSAPFAAPTTFSFGTPPSAQTNGIPAQTSGFGTPAAQPSTMSFSFASSAPTPPNNPFANGGSAPTASTAPFGFGTSNSPAQNAQSNPFASSQPQPSGFDFNFNANPPAAPTPNVPSFGGFNQSFPVASTPKRDSTAAGFAFGTPPSNNSAQPFSFGNTTPQATPPAFGFGASDTASRFGSPAPNGSPADSGFNMGMASDAQPPGSPSGRKIKPLKRSAVKR